MNSKNFKIIFFLVLVGLFTFTSCSSNDDAPPIDQIQNQVKNNLQSGTWKITKFLDSGDDETNHFTGYNFTFGSNGTLTVEMEVIPSMEPGVLQTAIAMTIPRMIWNSLLISI